jgi:ElaB/YqjD/DUF883 family membrane-anchored ribosome-binding protein
VTATHNHASTEELLQAARRKKADLERKHARAQAELDAVTERLRKVIEELKSLGFTTTEEAKEKTQALRTEAQENLKLIAETLENQPR